MEEKLEEAEHVGGCNFDAVGARCSEGFATFGREYVADAEIVAAFNHKTVFAFEAQLHAYTARDTVVELVVGRKGELLGAPVGRKSGNRGYVVIVEIGGDFVGYHIADRWAEIDESAKFVRAEVDVGHYRQLNVGEVSSV